MGHDEAAEDRVVVSGWLATLDLERRERAQALCERLRALGARDPEAWARSEVDDDLPELSRFQLLHHLWSEVIDACRDDLAWVDNLVHDAERNPTGPFADAGLALKRLLAAGADPRNLGLVARFVAYESAFSVIHALDEGYDPESGDDDDLPGWALVERDALGQVTGRALEGLHADLLAVDPSGREGRPG